MYDLTSSSEVFDDSGCMNGIKVIVGNNVTKISAYLFFISRESYAKTTNIASVEFAGESVCKKIGKYAFAFCTRLERVVIPDSVITIGEETFYGITNLTIYCKAESKPSGWHSNWNYSDCPVVWGYKGNN